MWRSVPLGLVVIVGVGIGMGIGFVLFEAPPRPLLVLEMKDRPVKLIDGWEKEQGDCLWSTGRGELELDDSTFMLVGPLRLKIEGEGMVSQARPKQSVNVVFNGSLVAIWNVAAPNTSSSLSFTVSHDVLHARRPPRLALIEVEPAIPSQIGGGNQHMPRSICLLRIAIYSAELNVR